MFNTVRFNIFAPDAEGAEVDEVTALVNQLADRARVHGPIAVVAILSSHQGSYDIELAGATQTLSAIADSYGIAECDLDWGMRVTR